MRALTVAIMLAGVSGPTWAQRATETETGSHVSIPQRARIPEEGSLNEADRIRTVMAQFARCTVDREYRKVEQALALPPGDAFAHAVPKLATAECLDSGQMRFSPIAIRGPLFTELYRRRAAAEKNGRSWGPLIGKVNLAVRGGGVDEQESQHLAVMAFGACVVAKDVDAARRVVLQPTASKAQNQAIVAIVPYLGACIEQGSTLRFGKQVLEGVLAEVLYRGVEAPAPVAAAESK